MLLLLLPDHIWTYVVVIVTIAVFHSKHGQIEKEHTQHAHVSTFVLDQNLINDFLVSEKRKKKQETKLNLTMWNVQQNEMQTQMNWTKKNTFSLCYWFLNSNTNSSREKLHTRWRNGPLKFFSSIYFSSVLAGHNKTKQNNIQRSKTWKQRSCEQVF